MSPELHKTMLLSLFDEIVDSMKLTTSHASSIPRSLEEVQRLVSTGSFELHLITHLLLQWTQLSVHIDVQIAVGDQNVIHL